MFELKKKKSKILVCRIQLKAVTRIPVVFWQNTNGVNFYNILTQDPDAKVSEKLSISAENFIGKTPTE